MYWLMNDIPMKLLLLALTLFLSHAESWNDIPQKRLLMYEKVMNKTWMGKKSEEAKKKMYVGKCGSTFY